VEEVQVAYREQASARTPGGLAGTAGRISGESLSWSGSGRVDSDVLPEYVQAVSMARIFCAVTVVIMRRHYER
jgi:hypothetical protein